MLGDRLKISIHAPRTGSDFDLYLRSKGKAKFQSTLPARGATLPRRAPPFPPAFQSTLPARGATQMRGRIVRGISDFNPRSPHGERLIARILCRARRKFQSTLPARGATKQPRATAQPVQFQSTLPARGATRQGRHDTTSSRHFNPRSPHGERPRAGGRTRRRKGISIHAPRTGSDV